MRYSKLNIIYRLQKWMDSVAGQTFLNYAYSWGASIVVLGTLFKLTHLPGADIMLYLGMGTEVIVFFFAAFDRPFDKTADGMPLSTSGSANEKPSSVVDLSQVESARERMLQTIKETDKQMGELTQNVTALNTILQRIRQALSVGNK